MSKTTRTTRLSCESLEARNVPAFLTPVTSVGSLANTGDFSGDGKADLVVADTATNSVSIRLGNGDGTFQPAGPGQSVPFMGAEVAVADFTGDGHLDVLVKGRASQTAIPSHFVVLRGAGDGTLLPGVVTAPTVTPNLPVQIQSFTTADMNNDGRTDVVFLGRHVSAGGGRSGITPVNTHFLIVMQSKSDGSGLLERTYSLQTAKTGSSVTTPPMGFHVADFNGDGKRDVMTVAASAAKTAYPSRLLLGTGTGTLTVGNSVGFVNVNLTVTHLDGDGKADVIRDNGNGTSTALLGKGDGKFTQKATIDVGGSVGVADVTGDGKADLVGINAACGTVKVFVGTGSGTFQSPRTFATGLAGANRVFVDDINGDSHLDLFVGNDSETSVLFNDGMW